MPLDAPVTDWTPDLSDFAGGGGEALNVIPGSRSYRPLKAFAAYSTTPLSARCQGAAYFRDTNGNARIYAGDATKLYLLSSASWTDASRTSGGAYAVGADDQVDFAQFGTLCISCNGTDTPQKITIDSGSNFAALGGTPPAGPRFVEVMGDFVVFGRLAANKLKVQWSAINNAEDYVASATTQSDSQIVPDGGDITGLIGYEYGGLVFQERAIRRMDYIGSPIIFSFKKIATDIGATIPGSVAGFADRAFFCHRSGFFMVVGGQAIVPIGAEKVDQTFWGSGTDALDTTTLTRVSAAIDPVNKVYGILYCGLGTGHGGVPNRLLIFHWDTGRWSHAQPGGLELVFSGSSQTGWTLDSLDEYNAGINLLSYTSSFANAAWTKTRCSIVAGQADPAGGRSAGKLVEDASTGSHKAVQAIAKAASSISYCASVYMKAAGRTQGYIEVDNGSGASGISCNYDLSAGTASGAGAFGSGFSLISAGTVSIGSGWWRCYLTFTSDADTALSCILAPLVGGAVSYLGDGSSGILLYGAQIEASGTSPSAYAPVPMTIDALPFSLDSVVWSGVPQPLFAGFNGSHNLGFFNGSNLAATVETSEQELFPGQRAILTSVRPMVDGSATPSVAIGWRNRLQDAVTYGSAVAADGWGYTRQRVNGRYLRGQITIPAAADWSHCLGLDDVQAVPAGRR
jgi:hypothetical protein